VSFDRAQDVGGDVLGQTQWRSNQSWSCATSALLSTLMFSSTFCVKPGLVKFDEPTSACDPMTSSRPCVM